MNINYVGDGVYFCNKDAKCKFVSEELIDTDGVGKVKTFTKNSSGVYVSKYFILEDYIKQVFPEFSNLENIWIGSTYGIYGFIIMDREPTILDKVTGSGFNYGSCNVIEVKEPGFILILGEDD